MVQLPKCGLVGGHDKPIHGSCAIYFPGGITFNILIFYPPLDLYILFWKLFTLKDFEDMLPLWMKSYWCGQSPRALPWKNWVQIHLGVSENRGTPKSSILIGFSIINHPFWGSIFLETPISLIHLSPDLSNDLALKSRNHTHGIPKMPDEAGPRISVAFLLGASWLLGASSWPRRRRELDDSCG